jgi:two-component system NtrC family sensor kinase
MSDPEKTRLVAHVRWLEQSLRECEKHAHLGRLFASIAHEIKNPLEAVTGVLYLLERDCTEERQLALIATATQEVKRAVEIANQTLDFSRETSSPVKVKISRIVDQVVRFYQRKISYKKLKFELRQEFDGDVEGFPGELRQIISNVLVNALEAVEMNRGIVKLHTYNSPHWKHGTLGVRIVIADNGPGIPPHHQQSLFQPFFTTKENKGTGLGLWVTHSFVKKHNGSIRLRSSIVPSRQGTCFAIFLPSHRSQVGTDSHTPVDAAS